MNNDINNFNYQISNIPNNQPLNTNINTTKKKKSKWLIPVLFFVGGVLMYTGSNIAEILIRSQEGEFMLDYQITSHPTIMIFRWLAIICWFMVIPSLIIVIVKYYKKNN